MTTLIDGHAPKWKEVRQLVIERDGCQCLVCRTNHDLTVHHLLPRRIVRLDTLTNLLTLCRKHHDEVEELDRIASYLDWTETLLRRVAA